MRLLDSIKSHVIETDKVLAATLIISFMLCLHGVTAKHMHPDQMAFVALFHEGELPFNPKRFEKPPFHTYVNFFLSVLPISVVSKVLDFPPDFAELTRRVWSRLLTVLLFLGSTIIVFHVTRKSFGILPARVTILLFATSAGFVAHSHFLTVDVPVMFWMLVAFYFSHNILLGGKLSDYVAAGFFTGIATATKYNGLAIGITIVAAHILFLASVSVKASNWKEFLFGRNLLVGITMVVVGFVAGNPFSILDYRTFKSDFLYNYMVTPVYEGQSGHSYGKFFSAMVELIGIPTFLILLPAFVWSIYFVVSNKNQPIQQATILISLCGFLLYYYKFGAFPRLETRFVLPIVPLWLIMAGPFWNRLKVCKTALSVLVISILSYNLICSFYVGERFLEDPRMLAETWVKEKIPQNSFIESDIYSPGWNEVPGVQLRETMMPFVTGRERLFEQLFKGNGFVVGSENDRNKADAMVRWYSLDELTIRTPDFIAVDSLYYRRFTEPGIRHELYPSMAEFYEALLDERYPYRIVFDKESKVVPVWVYPREIEFLHNRITILSKKELPSAN